MTLRRLIGLVRPFWRGMLASALLSVATIGSSIALMGTSAWLISKAGLQVSIADLGVAPVMVRFFGVSRAVFRYVERLVSHDVTFRLLARLRVWFYTAIEPLAPARLAQYRSGDLLGRVVTDVEELENIFIRVIAPPVVALIIGVMVTFVIALFDVPTALVVLAFFIIAGTGLPWMAWILGKGIGRELVETRAELNTLLVDNIQGMAEAVAYGREAHFLGQMESLNQRLAAQERHMGLLDGLQTGLMILMTHLAALCVLIVAIPRVDGIVLGTLALMTVAAFEAIMPLVPAAQYLSASLKSAERLFEIIDAEPMIHDPTEPSIMPQDKTLKVEHLSFRYAPDEPLALDDVSFTLEPGRTVAIVGASGAGKSTLVNLLLRFYDYDTGSIQLGGVELHDLDQADVRQAFGVMSQRTHLFNTTIRENIRIAREDASDIVPAAKQAQIHDFIESLPEGYITYVGEGGANLSGGERQRVALARVLLKDAPILILDEATANLDAITERDVLQSVYDAAGNRAMLIITHRLTMLDGEDEIIVLNQGRVVEHGTHAALMAQLDGVYRQMVDSQKRVITE